MSSWIVSSPLPHLIRIRSPLTSTLKPPLPLNPNKKNWKTTLPPLSSMTQTRISPPSAPLIRQGCLLKTSPHSCPQLSALPATPSVWLNWSMTRATIRTKKISRAMSLLLLQLRDRLFIMIASRYHSLGLLVCFLLSFLENLNQSMFFGQNDNYNFLQLTRDLECEGEF